MTNSIPEFSAETRVFLITGSNTTDTHPAIASHVLRARERGAMIIVVDPREIHMARLADLYLQPRPGTDIAWINGLMHVILNEGLYDRGFVEARCEGFEEFAASLAEYTPERVEEITGIPAPLLQRAARAYAGQKPAAILYTMGITQHTSGTDNVKALANLAMLTGNLGIPGGGVNPLRGQNNVQGACDMGALPDLLPGYQAVRSAEAREKFCQAWGCRELPAEPGLTVAEMVDAAGAGALKALYVVGENPVLSDPDMAHTVECLRKLELLVVQDIFPTETAALAHLVLPGVSFAEKDGTFTGTDRRVQRVRAAIAPLGEAKPDWQIVCLVARSLGAAGFEYRSPEEIMAEISQLVPQYAGVSYSRLDAVGSLQWPVPSAEHPGTPYLHKERFARGLGRFHAVHYRPPAEEPDQEYPLVLTTGRNAFQYHTGTMTRRTPQLEQEMPAPYVEMHPADIARFGLTAGGKVKVRSRRGEVELLLVATPAITPGTLFIPFHYAEAAANILTIRALDPVAKIPAYKVCAVTVEPVHEEEKVTAL